MCSSDLMDAYPADSKRELTLSEAISSFEVLEKKKELKWVAGRILSLRGQGAIIFITLNDGTASFQALFKKDSLGEEKFEFFNEVSDIGDFIEVQGNFFVTQRGEKTIEVKDWRILAKSLRPLPEKWHGLQDIEERFRKRYLDLLMDPVQKEILLFSQKFLFALDPLKDPGIFFGIFLQCPADHAIFLVKVANFLPRFSSLSLQ